MMPLPSRLSPQTPRCHHLTRNFTVVNRLCHKLKVLPSLMGWIFRIKKKINILRRFCPFKRLRTWKKDQDPWFVLLIAIWIVALRRDLEEWRGGRSQQSFCQIAADDKSRVRRKGDSGRGILQKYFTNYQTEPKSLKSWSPQTDLNCRPADYK